MFNNYFHLVHAFCVMFLEWPRWCNLGDGLMHLQPR